MKAFSNDNIKDKLCGDCDCSGFTADVSFVYAAPDSLQIVDESTYGTDSRKVVKITLVDKFGNKMVSSIAANDGDDTITMDPSSGLDTSEGFSILATVVTTAGCISDGSVHGVGVNTAEGSLGYWDKDNNAITVGTSES